MKEMDVIPGQLLVLCDLGLISTILPQTAPRNKYKIQLHFKQLLDMN